MASTVERVDALLKLGVIKESQATEWSQVHLVPKPTSEGAPQQQRFTLDFVRLNSASGGLEEWPFPNIQQIINRIDLLKSKDRTSEEMWPKPPTEMTIVKLSYINLS